MTDINQAREAIYQRFVTAWGSTSPYTFDNESFSPPSDAWVRLSVRNTDSGQETLGAIGNRKFLREGMVWLQVFVPLDSGLKDADTLSEAFRTIFEGVSFSNINFNRVVIKEGSPENQWYRVVAQAFFNYNVTK